MRRRIWTAAAVITLTGAILTVANAPSQAEAKGRFGFDAKPGRPQLSGVADPDILNGTGVTAARGVATAVGAASDDIQANGDNKANPSAQFGSGSGWPANETSIAINPTNPANVIASANDYEPGVDSIMGLYVSFDGGKTWPYSRHTRQVITPDRAMYGTGDPVVTFDRDGVAYASFIAFGRTNCDSYIGVIRSEDGGVTWSTVVDGPAPAGTLISEGDGMTVHNGGPEDCQIFHDKEWMTAGPRPAGATLVPGTDPLRVSVDRLYVTWTVFDSGPSGTESVDSAIHVAYSDDQGRNWSEPQEISGSAPFCEFQTGDQDAPACDEDQFSVPVVDPRNGHVYVAFENFNVNSVERNQYLVVKSVDGGATWDPPVKVADVFDGAAKYPVCAGRQTLDLMCARTNAAGNIDIDDRNGRLYLTFADNRNGTAENTNTDVFVVSSSDAGRTWSQPLNITGASVDDQWFPWLSVTPDGVVAVAYFDRRYSGPQLIDTSLSVSTNNGRGFNTRRVSERSWNADLAFRQGTFIGDYNGLATSRGVAIPCWTDARFAEPNVEGNNPPNQQSDVMVDPETIPTRR
ncbi:MAG TPA: sialidase family protein [Actinophytocola sp.]|uniref:sialidase family protein n=1 Tax=Actinophytocola sp. TaxID=1872138 RepID=UPI002DDD146D|nr:sialidase family protein [Actinophytocola sp.]HEV2782411.1 sialidase family protein [Actinophytocola sp.]